MIVLSFVLDVFDNHVNISWMVTSYAQRMCSDHYLLDSFVERFSITIFMAFLRQKSMKRFESYASY